MTRLEMEVYRCAQGHLALEHLGNACTEFEVGKCYEHVDTGAKMRVLRTLPGRGGYVVATMNENREIVTKSVGAEPGRAKYWLDVPFTTYVTWLKTYRRVRGL